MDIKKGDYFYRYKPRNAGGNIYWDIIKIVKIQGIWFSHRTVIDFTETSKKGIFSVTEELLTSMGWKPLFTQAHDVVRDIFIHAKELGDKRFYI
jgi:hypothetical protein